MEKTYRIKRRLIGDKVWTLLFEARTWEQVKRLIVNEKADEFYALGDIVHEYAVLEDGHLIGVY